MNQTEKQIDNILLDKTSINNARRTKKENHFELPPVTELPPEGFITGEEFWAGVKSDLKKLYLENGLL